MDSISARMRSMRRIAQQLVCLRDFGSVMEPLAWAAQQRHLVHSTGSLEPSAAAQLEQDGQPAVQLQRRLLRAGIIGAPNAGKSTLLNALVGQKVSAVSPKTNTTARCCLGAFAEGETQVVLFDTPGVVSPKDWHDVGQGHRVKSAWTAAADCSVLLFLVDAHRQLLRHDHRVVSLLSEHNEEGMPPAVLVMNKLDAVEKADSPRLLPLAEKLLQARAFEEVFWISAMRGHGVEGLREFLVSKAAPGDWELEDGLATDRPEADQAKELVREQLFKRFYKELPYELEIKLVSSKELRDGSLRIEFDIVAPTMGSKKIVVGTQGAAIGVVGRTARLELERMWKRRVHLLLNVKTAGGS